MTTGEWHGRKMEIISVKQMGKRRNEHGDSDCEGEMKKLIVITGKQGVAGAIPAGAAFLFSLLSSSFFFSFSQACILSVVQEWKYDFTFLPSVVIVLLSPVLSGYSAPSHTPKHMHFNLIGESDVPLNALKKKEKLVRFT